MKAIKDVFEKLEKILFRISLVVIFIMMILITVDSIGRYFLDYSIPGSYEFIEKYLMVIVIYLSISYTLKVGGHIHLDIFSEFIPKKFEGVLFYLNNILSILYFGIICYQGWIRTWVAWAGKEFLVDVINWPTYLAYIWVPLGSGLVIIRLFLMISEKLYDDLMIE